MGGQRVSDTGEVPFRQVVARGWAASNDSELHDCDQEWFWTFVDDPRLPFYYLPANSEWGIAHIESETVAHDWWKTPTLHVSRFCPWCGREFPASLRAERHRRLAEIGVDPKTDSVPEAYNSDKWWRQSEPTSG